MPKKKSSSAPANKYGIQNLAFGRPGFSLEAPVFNLPKEEKHSGKAEKKSVSKTSTVKANVKPSKSAPTKKSAKNIVKPTMRKTAGRGK